MRGDSEFEKKHGATAVTSDFRGLRCSFNSGNLMTWSMTGLA